MNRVLHIHGDNIVECERTLSLIEMALARDFVSTNGPFGSITCPMFEIETTRERMQLVMFPGFGRWDHNILDSIIERGGLLREAADVIVTAVEDGEEHLLFAIEFCGALPAGNQAWQRSGRAYSFAAAAIPYLYISELGGYELDRNRTRKAPRMPNPAVPFSYLSYSIKAGTPVFPIFVTAPGADSNSREIFETAFADQELLDFTRQLVRGEDAQETYEVLKKRVASFVSIRSKSARRGETLTAEQWEELFRHVNDGGSLTDYIIEKAPLPWSKTAYIEALTNRAKEVMDLGKEYGIGLTSKNLPMCLIPAKDRARFAAAISEKYKGLSQDFRDWLSNESTLAICWIMGFKPRGDDARPDRGLPPLTRMLVGEDVDLLSFVYGPAPKSTWKDLEEKPGDLAERNGLWEAILDASSGLLVDSATDSAETRAYLRSHWEKQIATVTINSFCVTPEPRRVGENDVDTALHLALSRLAGPDVFEGMCNPPGGDWSGVSILGGDRSVEYRWLSLPRVSGANMKRPDHVFQIFGVESRPIILSIESKESQSGVEENIGPRLIAYIKYLMASPPSISREGAAGWQHTNKSINPSEYTFASADAFISRDDIYKPVIEKSTKTDLTFLVCFAERDSCIISIEHHSKLGERIANHISKNFKANKILSIRVMSGN